MQLQIADERRLLGAMLTICDGILRVLAVGCRSTSYSIPQHQLLHNRIVDCYLDLQRPVDAIEICRYLADHDELEQIGGAGFVAGILNDSPTDHEFKRILSRYSQ